MAAKTQNHSPFSRISRLIRSGPSSPLARDPDVEVEPLTREDWYIPYNGPYEPPRRMRESVVERDGWGNLVSGWLEGDPQVMAENNRYTRTSRDRAMSDAAALTASSGNAGPSTRNRAFSTTRGTPRATVNSIIHLDQAGGVGEAPVPMREPLEARPKPEAARHSLASILTLGTRRGLSIRHSASVGQLSGQASGSADQHASPPPPTENASGTVFLRRHPYAFPYSSTATTSSPPRARSPSTSHARQSPPSKIRMPPRPSRTVPPPAYLQPTPRSRIRASISTPNLRNPQTASQARSPPPPTPLPKGKQRWLSPETWCDALILPRPRFAIRVDPGGGSGRIVSPPGSPVLPNTITYYQSRAMKEPTTGSSNAPDTGMTADSHEPLLTEQRTKSPRGPPPAPPIAGPSRVTVGEQRDAGRGSGDRHDADISKAPTSFKPPRPKSFALDDLALPSPVPSLMKVLEEGRQLEADRKAWQSQATRSFQNKRARSVSRARAKTLSAAHRPAREGRASAMDVLAERTLFGNQSRPPTVHVRLQESKSQGFRSSEEAATGTVTSGGGVGVSTFTSHSHGHGHTRSHAHSNSVGTATSSHGRTEESFMWGGSGAGHHRRSHSLSKSALRLVKNTASTAAGFCGFASAERVGEGGREKVGTPVDEKGGASDMLESALRRQDTRVLRIEDQAPRDGIHDNVVLITPASHPEHGAAQTIRTGPGGTNGLSPVPSAMSSSGEGPVGIAISTPTPSDEVNRQRYGGRERLRFPAHPYAQGATFPMRSSSPQPERAATRPPDPQHDRLIGDDAFERHRQPVLVHPYAPFAQTNHPYASASASAGWVKPEPHNATVQPTVRVVTPAEDDSQEVEIPADKANSMYAELTPGHIREFKPEELRYSPFIMVHPVEQQRKGESLSPLTQSHPYSAQSKRMSEWDFAGALTETLRDRGSVDSGLGTSESLEHLRDTERIAHADATGSLPVLDDLPPVPLEDPSERLRLGMGRREAARSSSNHTFASSPMEFVNPPSFRVQPTEDRLTPKARSHSSGSSPGMISHDSSPPLSPRSLAATDDLERFRDLFYQPPPRPETPEEPRDETVCRHLPSRQPSSSVSTRSVSGLTTLARQLAEDLDEIRLLSRDSIDDSEASPMWGRRFGGLRGQRPEDAGPDPNIVLSAPSSDVSTPPEASSPPLRFPIDQNASLAAPTINVPEDVEESSRASSIIEYAPREESDTGHMRVGNIEALTTPAALSSPQRSSARLSFVHFLRDNEQRTSQDVPAARVNSAYSSLGAPLSSDAARSSFMTSGTSASRMSGLSDFPVPPTDITPEQLSVLNSYFDDNRNSQQDNGFLSPPRPGVLVREPSTTTFGGQTEIGQAL